MCRKTPTQFTKAIKNYKDFSLQEIYQTSDRIDSRLKCMKRIIKINLKFAKM